MAKKKLSPLNEDFDFKLLVTIAKKNSLWFLLFMVLSGLVAALILRYTAPIYEASSIIRIANENNAHNVLGMDANQRFYEDNRIAGDIELIRSRVIVERALNKLPLRVGYFSKGAVLEYELYRQNPFVVEFSIRDSNIYDTPVFVEFTDSSQATLNYTAPGSGEQVAETLTIGQWKNLPEFDLRISITNFKEIAARQQEISKDAFYFRINRIGNMADNILNDLMVVPLNLEAQTIQIKLKEKNPLKASDIVNAITREFNTYDVEKNSEVSNKVLDFIDNTIASIDIQLSNSEDLLEKFKKDNRIISPEQALSTISGKLDNLTSQQFSIDYELSLYKKIRQDISENNDIGKFLLSISGSAEKNLILSQIQRLQDLLDQRDQIRIQATENSELYKAIDKRVKSQRDLLTQTLLNEEIQLKVKRAEIQREIDGYEGRFGQIPGQQAEYGRLQRLFTINEKFYSLLLEKKAEFSITRAGYVPQHIILQEAKPNTQPVRPNKPLILASCLMVGFLFSFGLILIRYLLYNEINALEEIGHYTDAALLGIVPKYKREIPVSQLLVDKNPKSVISEAFRSIRTNLQFISNEDGAKMIAVTSTISGEGKTFNAINLAGVIAFSGKKVVILDLDMRKPKIHLGFNVENNQGISTLMIGKNQPEECIVKSSLPNLDFITAGPIPPNPAELIINPRMDELLNYLRTRYDIIIVDLPPVGIVSDGIPMMQKADYPIYILRANYSRKMFIMQINKLMSENKVNNLSIILNGVEMSRIRYGYGYGYSYGYGYGYGYSYGYGYYEEEDKPKNIFDRIKLYFIRRP